MTTVLSQKGQVVIPNSIRSQLHLEPGDDMEVTVEGDDTILLRRISRRVNEGLLEHLLSCPEPFEVPARENDAPRDIELS